MTDSAAPDPRAIGAHDCPRCGDPYSLDGCGCPKASAAGVPPEECPEPPWHETHRYCPRCTWYEEPCRQQLILAQGELGVVVCTLPPGHEGKHQTQVEWL